MTTDRAFPFTGVRKTTAKSPKQMGSENYRRQKKTLYTKLEKMHVQFGANMCLFLERNGKFEIFTSHGQMLSKLGLNEAKSKLFPPPPIITARKVATRECEHIEEIDAPTQHLDIYQDQMTCSRTGEATTVPSIIHDLELGSETEGQKAQE